MRKYIFFTSFYCTSRHNVYHQITIELPITALYQINQQIQSQQKKHVLIRKETNFNPQTKANRKDRSIKKLN